MGEILKRTEADIRNFVTNAVKHPLQTRVTCCRLFHIHQAVHVRHSAGDAELILDTGELHIRGDPTVRFPINCDEDVRPTKVASINISRWIRPCPSLEDDRKEI